MAIEGYDLFDRLFLENPFPSTDERHQTFHIGGHLMDAVLVEYAEGESTRTQIIGGLELGAEATTDLDVLLAGIDAEPTAFEKVRFAMNFAAVHSAAEAGLKYTDKAAFKTRLGL